MSQVVTPALVDVRFDMMKMRESIAHWILMHGHPFTIVKEEGFNMMQLRGMLQWECTSRASIKNDCVKVYEIEKKKLKNYLKGINKIIVTTDMWKSTNQKIEYMVLTGHFVDSNWRLQKHVLSFIHLPPPHRGIVFYLEWPSGTLAIPITTVASEATFSAGSRVIGNLWLPKQLKSYFVEEIGVEVYMDLKERTRKRRCQSRYEYGKVLPLKLSNSYKMSYSEMLDMIVYKLECEIWGLFYCIPRNSLEIGLKIIEGDPDIKKMYDMAEMYGLINLYIAHVAKNLAAYYFRNLSFDDYHGDIQSKLKSHEKLKMDVASMTFDEVVAWEKEESLSPLLRTPPLKPRRIVIEFLVKNQYAEFLHADCVDDHFDPLDYCKYEDVYGGGCFDVGGYFKGFDWIDEPVGSDDRSLLGKSKDEFSNEVILDDVVSSPATNLSLLLKRKGKSRVKFTRMRAIIKRSKMLSLRKYLRSNYGRFVTMIGLNEDVGDDDLKDTGCSFNNDLKDHC
ncbi:transposase, MuDR, MULE transposase domain protein [Tanacetum coccineum]|uniref:Transposase, MuDR, MULE transposase domain protein n=1 Tax=Tanacetum coccineum TaxID=301880 RepID=A0ABQ4WP58_9ASTR